MAPPKAQRRPGGGGAAAHFDITGAAKNSPTRRARQTRRSRKVKLPRWIIPELRPLVRETASRGGLERVQAMVFLEGRPGARVNAARAVGAGKLSEFYNDSWLPAVHAAGGSVLLVFERKDDAREAKQALDTTFELGRKLALAIAPAAGRA